MQTISSGVRGGIFGFAIKSSCKLLVTEQEEKFLIIELKAIGKSHE